MLRKKVLIFLQDGVGGAERMSVLIAKMLDLNTYDVVFVAIEIGKPENRITDFISDDYQVIHIHSGGACHIIKSIYNVIRAETPFICFSSALYINDKLLLLKPLFPNIRFIIRCENYLFTYSKKQKLVVRIVYKLADIIIAQTREMADELVAECDICSDKIHTLENPVDTQTIQNKLLKAQSPYPSNGKKHYVAVGRFAYQKGFDLLVKAFYQVRDKRKDVDLYIVGPNTGGFEEEYNKVSRIINEGLYREDIHCVGYQKNPYAWLKYADAFVLSSRWEGLPNVMIEALYLGTPVAAFKCIPIIERIIANGENGFCVSKDDSEQLAEAMNSAVDMGRIQSIYKGAEVSEFQKLFDL